MRKTSAFRIGPMVRWRKAGPKNHNIGSKKVARKNLVVVANVSVSGAAAIKVNAPSTIKRVVRVAVNP